MRQRFHDQMLQRARQVGGGLALALLTLWGAAFGIAGSAAAQPASDGPALWRLGDEDTTLYLFGSIHMMTPEVSWFEGDVKAAFDAAETVTFEIDFDDLDQAQVRAFVMANSRLPDDRKLSDILSSAMMDELMSVFSEAGIPRAKVETMRPWFAAFQYGQLSAVQAGFLPQYGVDVVLTQQAKAAGKEIRGLETIEAQFETLMTIDEMAGKGAFEAQMEQFEDPAALFDQMKTDWMTADLEGLDTLLIEPSRAMAPAFHETVFDERNADWVPQIEAMLDRPGTHMVVVGTGHLIGDDSVVDLLRERGHQVTVQ